MKMPKELTDQLTQVRNKADQIFAFYRIDNEDVFTVYSKGEIEDTIYEVLNSDDELLEMFETIIDEIYQNREDLN